MNSCSLVFKTHPQKLGSVSPLVATGIILDTIYLTVFVCNRITQKQFWVDVRSFVRFIRGGGWRLAVFRHAFSHRQRWGLDMAQCASSLTLGLVLFVYRAQLSRRVSLAECRVRASYRSTGPCHLLSTPAALTTPGRPRSRCDGLSQFNEDTGGPSCTLPENNLMQKPDSTYRQGRETNPRPAE